MSRRKTLRKSGGLRTRWSPAEIRALVLLNLLDFVPDELARFDTDNSLPHITHAVGMTVRDDVRQRWHLSRWLESERVWNIQLWRDLVRVRYGNHNANLLAVVPQTLIEKIESEVRPRNTRYWRRDRRRALLSAIVRARTQGPLQALKRWAACLYALAVISGSAYLLEALHSPAGSEIVVKMLWGIFSTFLNPESDPPSKDEFLRYLIAEDGSSDSQIGVALHFYLDIEEPYDDPEFEAPTPLKRFWPRRNKWSSQVNSDAYQYVKATFKDTYEIEDVVFEALEAELDRLVHQRSFTETIHFGPSVFWMARIVEHALPAHFNDCILQVKFFRQEILAQVLRSQVARITPAIRVSVERFQRTLRAEPLVRCVFHALVFGRSEATLLTHKPGRPSSSAARILSHLGAELLSTRYKNVENVSPAQILPDSGRLGTYTEFIKSCTGTGVYDLLSPLLTVLLNIENFSLSPRAVYLAHRRELKDRLDQVSSTVS